MEMQFRMETQFRIDADVRNDERGLQRTDKARKNASYAKIVLEKSSTPLENTGNIHIKIDRC